MSLKRILGQQKAFYCTTKKENKIEIAISVLSKSIYMKSISFEAHAHECEVYTMNYFW